MKGGGASKTIVLPLGLSCSVSCTYVYIIENVLAGSVVSQGAITCRYVHINPDTSALQVFLKENCIDITDVTGRRRWRHTDRRWRISRSRLMRSMEIIKDRQTIVAA